MSKTTLKIWDPELLYTPHEPPVAAGENDDRAETHLQPCSTAEDDAEEGKPQGTKSATTPTFPP